MNTSRSGRFAALLVLAATAALPVTAQSVVHLTARLTGDQEVPPITTSAAGWATVRVDTSNGDTEVFCHVEGLSPVAAHLHFGATGQNGPLILGLVGGPDSWFGTGTLNPTLVAAVLQGDSYVNVHSTAHAGGELRGQVAIPTSTRFVAAADGTQTLPPTGSSATGEFVAFLHEPDGVLTYELDLAGLNARAAHLHVGAPGQNGGVVVPLRGSGTRFCGVSDRLSAATLADLRAGRLYVNVHTATFPGGEIRGQVGALPGSWRADLDGSQEVPPVTTSAFGTGCFTLNPDGTLDYRVEASGLTARAAHLHVGAAGTNGGVVFPLRGGPTLFQGTTPALTDAQLGDLASGRYYVNVHTAANPGGEIRGQVFEAPIPTTFGSGCPRSGGTAPEIGARGAACPGTSVEVTLSGASANVPAALLLGIQRGPGPLGTPLDLGLLGADGCYAFLAPIVQGGAASTDGLGCAEARLPVPFGGNLAGELLGQWFVLDPNANGAGLATSNALSIPLSS